MPPYRITIVEDDEPIRHMYTLKLRHEGFEVSGAKNGLEGLQIIELHKPDLILLDLKMPIMNGEEMLNLIRREEWGMQIKVVVLTNISKSEAPATLRLLKVERYILKVHYTPQQVVDIVKEVIAA